MASLRISSFVKGACLSIIMYCFMASISSCFGLKFMYGVLVLRHGIVTYRVMLGPLFRWCDSSWLRLVLLSMGVISAQPRYPLACFVTFSAISLLLLPCFHLRVATKSAATGESCECFFIDLRDYFCLLFSTFISPDAFMRGSDRRCRFGISASCFEDAQRPDQSFYYQSTSPDYSEIASHWVSSRNRQLVNLEIKSLIFAIARPPLFDIH